MKRSKAIEDAQQSEQLVRALAFLRHPVSILGVKCRQLTLRHVLLLTAAQNSFIGYKRPLLGDVFDFLWVLSPLHRTPRRPAYLYRKRRSHGIYATLLLWVAYGDLRTARYYLALERLVASVDLAFAELAIRGYLEQAMQDAPPRDPDAKEKPFAPRCHMADSLCEVFWRDYGSAPESTLDRPIAELNAILRMRTIFVGGDVIDPSAAVIQEELTHE
jgi:hypothetical protein